MHDDDFDRGLAYDLKVLRLGTMKRRELLGWTLGATLIPLVGCGSSGDSNGDDDGGTDGGLGSGGASGSGGANTSGGASTSGGAPGTGGGNGGTCSKIPAETGG